MSDDNKEGAAEPVVCAGKNCGTTTCDHSPECIAEHEAAYSSGIRPPAVTPAAPSDAVRPCEYCDDIGDVHGLDGEWRGVCICPAGIALAQPVQEVATTPAMPKGDLSKVWQAADDVCEWLNYEVWPEKSPGLMKSVDILNEEMMRAEIRASRAAPNAEPAAGEQAGAVAWINSASLTTFGIDRERYPLGGGGDMATARYMRSDHHDTPLYLAAPGAAIAAREQEADLTQFAPKFSGASSPEPTLERIIWRYYLGHIDDEQEAQNYAATYVDALRTALASREEEGKL